GQSCNTGLPPGYCGSGTYSDNFMPHPNVGGLHLKGGIELMLDRDLALHFFVDGQRWIVFNADDNNSVAMGLGVIFFT
ncbi:MAG: hypothetical protein V3T05_01060, partial [Myxococcota bacterium]